MMRLLMCWIGALALAGCVGGNGEPGSADDAASEPQSMNVEPALSDRAEQARNDLAKRLRLNADEIRIEQAEFVTWRNGAIGCPEPGTAYTEALVPGYRIVLGAQGRLHHYHGARDRAPFHCPSERIDKPLPGQRATPEVI